MICSYTVFVIVYTYYEYLNKMYNKYISHFICKRERLTFLRDNFFRKCYSLSNDKTLVSIFITVQILIELLVAMHCKNTVTGSNSLLFLLRLRIYFSRKLYTT